MNKRISKKVAKNKGTYQPEKSVTVQEAWDVISQYLKDKRQHICCFVDSMGMDNKVNIHSTDGFKIKEGEVGKHETRYTIPSKW